VVVFSNPFWANNAFAAIRTRSAVGSSGAVFTLDSGDGILTK